MGASRLPNKVLMPLAGKPVLEHVIRRCQHAQLVNRVIVATTVELKDLDIVNFVGGTGISVFSGSANDVLDRYYRAARLFELQHVVRITADCPMIDPDVIDRVIAEYFDKEADYAANTLEETYPDGEDVEVFSFDVLSRTWNNAKMPSEREHVTPYIRKNEIFRKVNIRNEANWGHCRWTLDEPGDYQKLKHIFNALYERKPYFGMHDVFDFLAEHPEIDRINSGIARNEGYAKSIRDEERTAEC